MNAGIEKKTIAVGVVGTGTMGRGIAQTLAAGGFATYIHDSAEGAAQRARDAVGAGLDKLAAKGKLTAEQVADTMGCLHVVDTLGGLAHCQVVVEAIVEDLSVKQALFQQLEGIVADDAIIATNTSSLSVTAMAAACRRPSRVAGWHFFNPVPLMKIAEVIEGALTDQAVAQALGALTRAVGHTPVLARDMPGFVVNHANRGMSSEGLRVQQEGVADFATIDATLREVAGFRMGPFELLDLLGLDVAKAVIESIYHQFQQEPRFRPTPLVAQRVAAGLLGRKSGRGFYDYGGQPPAAPAAAATQPAPVPVWVSDDEPELGERVRELLTRLGARVDRGAQAPADALIVVTPVGEDVSSCAVRLTLDPARTVGVDALFRMDKRRSLMASPATAAAYAAHALAAFGTDGVPCDMLRDSPGFIAQRVVAMIVCIGCDIAQQRIASPADINLAARLGLGYPMGPLELGDAVGAARVLQILERLFDCYKDPRYRPSPWLQRRARLGLSLTAPD